MKEYKLPFGINISLILTTILLSFWELSSGKSLGETIVVSILLYVVVACIYKTLRKED